MKETYIARSVDVAARRLGDGMVVMSAVDSTLFTLNDVAAVLWQAADGRTPLREIVARNVCEKFDVEPETARHDAEEFVRALAAHGILAVSDQPIPAAARAAEAP
jgi:hypothetical protein